MGEFEGVSAEVCRGWWSFVSVVALVFINCLGIGGGNLTSNTNRGMMIINFGSSRYKRVYLVSFYPILDCRMTDKEGDFGMEKLRDEKKRHEGTSHYS